MQQHCESMYSYEQANALLDEIDDERDSFGEVFRIKKLLDNEHSHSENLLFESLRMLQLMELPVDAIKATSILSSVKRMRGNTNKRIKDLANVLIKGWKFLLDEWLNNTKDITETTPDSVNSLPALEEELPCLNGLAFPPLDIDDILAAQTASFDISKFFDAMDDDGNLICKPKFGKTGNRTLTEKYTMEKKNDGDMSKQEIVPKLLNPHRAFNRLIKPLDAQRPLVSMRPLRQDSQKATAHENIKRVSSKHFHSAQEKSEGLACRDNPEIIKKKLQENLSRQGKLLERCLKAKDDLIRNQKFGETGNRTLREKYTMEKEIDGEMKRQEIVPKLLNPHRAFNRPIKPLDAQRPLVSMRPLRQDSQKATAHENIKRVPSEHFHSALEKTEGLACQDNPEIIKKKLQENLSKQGKVLERCLKAKDDLIRKRKFGETRNRTVTEKYTMEKKNEGDMKRQKIVPKPLNPHRAFNRPINPLDVRRPLIFMRPLRQDSQKATVRENIKRVPSEYLHSSQEKSEGLACRGNPEIIKKKLQENLSSQGKLLERCLNAKEAMKKRHVNVLDQKDFTTRKPQAALKLSPTVPDKLDVLNYEDKVKNSKRKLGEGNENAKNENKRRRIMMLDLKDLPMQQPKLNRGCRISKVNRGCGITHLPLIC